MDKVGCFHDSIIQWPTLKTVIQKNYEDQSSEEEKIESEDEENKDPYD